MRSAIRESVFKEQVVGSLVGATNQTERRALMAKQHGQGASPYGIWLLADSYQTAASAVSEHAVRMLTDGPTRLLLHHACELYLKAYLRLHGKEPDDLRAYGHDIMRMLADAGAAGLLVSHETKTAVCQSVELEDYVRVRYEVVHGQRVVPLKVLARSTADLRESVRAALIQRGIDPGP